MKLNVIAVIFFLMLFACSDTQDNDHNNHNHHNRSIDHAGLFKKIYESPPKTLIELSEEEIYYLPPQGDYWSFGGIKIKQKGMLQICGKGYFSGSVYRVGIDVYVNGEPNKSIIVNGNPYVSKSVTFRSEKIRVNKGDFITLSPIDDQYDMIYIPYLKNITFYFMSLPCGEKKSYRDEMYKPIFLRD